MDELLRYPQRGCIVEFLEGNEVKTARVVEESGDRVRLLLPNRRSMNLPKNRILPWIGPKYGEGSGLEDMVKSIVKHANVREQMSASLDVLGAWEVAWQEMSQATVEWICELMESEPSIDLLAAYGRAMLACKTHFRFQPPYFLLYSEEQVANRLREKELREEREQLFSHGRAFVHLLWDVACGKKAFPTQGSLLLSREDICVKIEALLQAQLKGSLEESEESLWQEMSSGLPEQPNLAVLLLQAWGKLPAHYNCWLAQSDYDVTDCWKKPLEPEIHQLLERSQKLCGELSENTLPFISIDGAETKDIDDAFFVEQSTSGFELTVALAAHSLPWVFGDRLDEAVLARATSLYLPEGTSHMLPATLGTDAFSLVASKPRLAFLVHISLDASGTISSCTPSVGRINVAANLTYTECEEVLCEDGGCEGRAQVYAKMLKTALLLAQLRQQRRIEDGACVMDRLEPEILLEGSGEEIRVHLEAPKKTPCAQLLVSEIMITANAALADWAAMHDIALLHRTQDVDFPKRYAGIWTREEDMAVVMRSLVPSLLEVVPKRHAALGLERYAPLTSPLRRYADLVNVAQITQFLYAGNSLFDKDSLEALCKRLLLALGPVVQIQRARPRYWKLVYLKQQGDRVWYEAVVTDVNEYSIGVSLPELGLPARVRLALFDFDASPGTPCLVRIGKVQPYANEFQIIAVQEHSSARLDA